jgi:threonine synthase
MVIHPLTPSKACPLAPCPTHLLTPSTACDHGVMSDPTATPELRCRECGAAAPPDGPQYCDRCFGPVEVVLPTPGEAGAVVSAIADGPATVARYRPLMPPGLRLDDVAAGWTPYAHAHALGDALGVAALWVKDETANPTGSFKDRVVDVALARASTTDATVAACTSTGNLARAVAVGAARRGMACVVLVPDTLPADDVDALASLGAQVMAVRGGYDAASRLGADAASDLADWAWINVGLRPWYEIGARTLAWEIAEQSGWRLPDRVVAPMASGALARALYDGFSHLVEHGITDGPLPRLTTVEPAGCSPAADAFAAGEGAMVRPVRPDTLATSLAMGDPPDADAVIAAARRTGGEVMVVPEADILPATALVARTTGIATEPAGGVVAAAIGDLVRAGRIGADERVVAVITGSSSSAASGGVVSQPGVTATIDPAIGALLAALPAHVTG